MSYFFGTGFPEEIIQSDKRRRIKDQLNSGDDTAKGGRWWFFSLLLIFGIGALFIRLFHLTVIDGKIYRELSLENRIREDKIPAVRGIIYDRNGQILVRNIPVFKTKDGNIFFEEKPATVSGEVTEGVGREYVYSSIFSHVLGYTGEVSPNDIRNNPSYEPGDLLGKMGIEKSYDVLLRGKNGKELKEVDATGETVRVLGRVSSIPGKNLTLTLDLDIGKIAASVMEGKKGAVVVANPKTGEILALYSSPSFDPNIFIRTEGVENIFNDENQPLFNRAISGEYPPGSTFKVVTAISALEENAINRDTQIEDTGVITIGSFSFGNWYFNQYGKKEGVLDIIHAFKRSNDIFFYKTGEMVGIKKLSEWAKILGIGKTLGIDIAGEAKGLMPDEEWRGRVKGEKWYLGDTYHVAIGQGDLLASPLQVNAWTNAVADGGRLCRPHLVGVQNEQCKDLGIKKETIGLIREGMKEACSPGGTGWPMFNFKVHLPAQAGSEKFRVDGIDFLETLESTTSGKPIVEISTACKTGTAEYGDPKGRTHAWFTDFAPVENPQISVTVLVEGGGEGSNVAAPIAKKILEEWFGR